MTAILSMSLSSAASADHLPRFVQGEFRVSEDVGQAQISVTREPPTGRAFIKYDTTDGAATAPADYAATSGILVFEDGQKTLSFSVPIVADSVSEGDESLGLVLSAYGREDGIHGGVPQEGSTATLTIAGDAAGANTAPPNMSLPGNPAAPSGPGTGAPSPSQSPGQQDTPAPGAVHQASSTPLIVLSGSPKATLAAKDAKGEAPDTAGPPGWRLAAALAVLAAAGALAWAFWRKRREA